MSARAFAAAALVAALAACTSVPVRPPAQTAVLDADAQARADARLVAREAAVRALPEFAFTGRVAMSNGRDGGSGRIDWRQVGDRFEVALAAPVTRQSWRLIGGPGGARIEGLDGGPRDGADVGQLLWEATGFDIPVAALAAWAAGTRADPLQSGEAELEYTADGQLARLRQDGWTIDYLDWQPVAAEGAPALPVRINAARDAARVRLIVDAWTLDPVAAP
ncbi:lipoprotein insertase outer membrane protein LolB [Luteimonas sp. WGS1318]|uniref:lipoprotein insertase outer membrane protein LolB n=1 Tax=Luteimonas sp. WGS1318 TaxID=3366815 RepID=UPI00372D8246